jgi:hypothetical protein
MRKWFEYTGSRYDRQVGFSDIYREESHFLEEENFWTISMETDCYTAVG